MTGKFGINQESLEKEVFNERMRQYMTGERINALSGPFAAGPFFVYLLHGYVENSVLLTWWLLLLSADGASIILTTIYFKSHDIKKPEIWMNVQIFFQIMAGFVWGLSVFMFRTETDVTTQIYNYTILMAVTGVTSVSLLPVYRAYMRFSLAIWLFPIVYFLYLGDDLHVKLALGIIVLLIVLNVFGYNTSKQIKLGIYERFRASQLSNVLAEALQKIEVMATTDELTNLYNRRYGIKHLNKEYNRQKRYGYDVSLIIFDIDKFKRINDEYGHLIGDKVLQHISRLAQFTVRKEDILSRYGGEEFLVVMPHTSSKQAEEIAERIRATFEDNPFNSEGLEIVVTASFGLTAILPPNKMEEQIDRADKALYQAKANGRNRVDVLL